MNAEMGTSLYEKATSLHKQFNSEYNRCIENYSNAKGKRVLEKLTALLWMIRSNIAHGSKIEINLDRNKEVADLVSKILFYIADAILNWGTKNLAVYGELRRGGSLFNSYMSNMHFITNARINGDSWNYFNTKWVDVDVQNASTEVEVFLCEYEKLFVIDEIESLANRRIVPFFNGHIQIGFAWVYSRGKSIVNENDVLSINERDKKIYQKCYTFMYAIYGLEQKFKNKKFENYSNKNTHFLMSSMTILNNINGPLIDDKDKIFNFKYAAEIVIQIELIRKTYENIWGSLSGFNSIELSIYKAISGEIIEWNSWLKQVIEPSPRDYDDGDLTGLTSSIILMIFEFLKAETCKLCNDHNEDLYNEVLQIFKDEDSE